MSWSGRVREYIADGMTEAEAIEQVRAERLEAEREAQRESGTDCCDDTGEDTKEQEHAEVEA